MSKNLTWKLLSSEYIHKGPWATLRIDRCEMPNGKIVDDYYVLEYSNWVNAVAITEDNMVLMVKQYHSKYRVGLLMVMNRRLKDCAASCWKKPVTSLMILNYFVPFTAIHQLPTIKLLPTWLRVAKKCRTRL
jgi:hypothetical protein